MTFGELPRLIAGFSEHSDGVIHGSFFFGRGAAHHNEIWIKGFRGISIEIIKWIAGLTMIIDHVDLVC